MKRAASGDPLVDLYLASEEAAKSSAARSIRNKLTERDLRRARLLTLRSTQQGSRITLDEIAADINDVKEGVRKVHKSTLCRHLGEVGIRYSPSKGDYPEGIDLPRWLAQRRGFCDRLKKMPKEGVLFGDEAFFGLTRRAHTNELRAHVDGHAAFPRRHAVQVDCRVAVWGAVGLDLYTPIAINEDGMYLNAEEYARIMDSMIIPALRQYDGNVVLFEDNCSIHGTENVRNLFRDNEIDHRFLPPYSCDIFSWVEKVWANVGERVYRGGKKYGNKDELTRAVHNEWERLVGDDDYRRRLVMEGQAACKKIIDSQSYRVHW